VFLKDAGEAFRLRQGFGGQAGSCCLLPSEHW